jgi:predicted phosphodiesterase
MRVAVLSDIHGNRHAFEAVLAAVSGEAVEAIWCLGDIVGYGADPNACLDLARRHTDACLAGNHDLAVRGELPIAEFSHEAGDAAIWTQGVVTPRELEYLRSLEPTDLRRAAGLYHASPRDPVWEYVLSTGQADACLDAQEHRVAFIGHSHVALSFTRPEGEVTTGSLQPCGSTVAMAGGHWLVNPGSVGQPRDGDPRAAWLLLDTDSWRATFRRTPYDVAGAAAAIDAAGLPRGLGERLQHGQ